MQLDSKRLSEPIFQVDRWPRGKPFYWLSVTMYLLFLLTIIGLFLTFDYAFAIAFLIAGYAGHVLAIFYPSKRWSWSKFKRVRKPESLGSFMWFSFLYGAGLVFLVTIGCNEPNQCQPAAKIQLWIDAVT